MFFNDHLKRFFRNLKAYYGDIFEELYYENLIESSRNLLFKTIELNKDKVRDFYFRISLIPSLSEFKISKEIELYSQVYLRDLNEKTTDIKTLKIVERTQNVMPFGKSGTYMAQNFDLRNVLKDGFDDVLYVSKEGELLETSTSNIILIDQVYKKFWTSQLAAKIYSGIIIEKTSQALMSMGFVRGEEKLHLSMVENHHMMLLTNSVNLISGGVINENSIVDMDFANKIKLRLKNNSPVLKD